MQKEAGESEWRWKFVATFATSWKQNVIISPTTCIVIHVEECMPIQPVPVVAEAKHIDQTGSQSETLFKLHSSLHMNT